MYYTSVTVAVVTKDVRNKKAFLSYPPRHPESNLESINMVLTFTSVDETIVCDHSNESYRAVLSCGTVCF